MGNTDVGINKETNSLYGQRARPEKSCNRRTKEITTSVSQVNSEGSKGENTKTYSSSNTSKDRSRKVGKGKTKTNNEKETSGESTTDFSSNSEEISVKTTSKYKAVATNGFKSTLENRVSEILAENNIDFCYECESIILVPKFEFSGKKYRELKYTPDFIITINDIKYYLEIKGFETPEFKLKWKLLHYHLSLNPIEGIFVVIKSLKELKTFINANIEI